MLWRKNKAGWGYREVTGWGGSALDRWGKASSEAVTQQLKKMEPSRWSWQQIKRPWGRPELGSLVFQRNKRSPSAAAVLEHGEVRHRLTTSSVILPLLRCKIFQNTLYPSTHTHTPTPCAHHLQVYPKWETPGTCTLRTWAPWDYVCHCLVTKPQVISITLYTWLSTYKTGTVLAISKSCTEQ